MSTTAAPGPGTIPVTGITQPPSEDFSKKMQDMIDRNSGKKDAPPATTAQAAKPSVDIPPDIIPDAKPVIPKKEDNKDEAIKAMRIKADSYDALKTEFDKFKEESQKKTIPSDYEQIKADYENLKKNHDEIKNRLSKFDIEQDEDFQNKFKKPLDTKESEIKDVITSLGGQDNVFDTVQGMDLKGRLEYLKTNFADYASMLVPMFAQYDAMARQLVQAVENHTETAKKIHTERSENLTGPLFNEAMNRMGSYELLRRSQQDQKWNELVDNRIAKSKSIITEFNKDNLPELALKSVMVDEYRSLYLTVKESNKKLQEEMAMLKGGTLPVGSTHAAGGAETQKPKTAEEGLGMIASKYIRK